MDEPSLSSALTEALTTTTAGATGVARLAIDGLVEMAADRARLTQAVAHLRERLTGYAPLWHIAEATTAVDPAVALRRLRAELDETVEKSVSAASSWLADRPGAILAAPTSSVVERVLDRIGPRPASGVPAVGLAGADAIGERAILNIRGTGQIARQVPTLVVTGALKLVPEHVFQTLHGRLFERTPLDWFAAVVVDGELLSPGEAGARAAEMGSGG